MYFRKSFKPLLCAFCALLAITAVNATGFQQAPHVKIINGIPYPDTNTSYSPVSNETNSSGFVPTGTSTGIQNGTSLSGYLQDSGKNSGQGSANQSISNLTGPSSPNSTSGTAPVVTPGVPVTMEGFAATPTTTPTPSTTAGGLGRTNTPSTTVPTPVTGAISGNYQGAEETPAAGEPGNSTETSTNIPLAPVLVPVTTISSAENLSPGEYGTSGEPLTSRFSNVFPFTADDLSEFARMKAFPPIELIERLIGATFSPENPATSSHDIQAINDTGTYSGNETVPL